MVSVAKVYPAQVIRAGLLEILVEVAAGSSVFDLFWLENI